MKIGREILSNQPLRRIYNILVASANLTLAKMVSATQVPNIKAASMGQWDSRCILCPGSIDHTIFYHLASCCITNTW